MVHSFLHKPESAQGVFEEHTLTIWTDSELTMSFLNRGDTPTVLERAAEAYTGQKRRVKFQVGKPPVQADAAPGQTHHSGRRPHKRISLMICWP